MEKTVKISRFFPGQILLRKSTWKAVGVRDCSLKAFLEKIKDG
jgi:hypothetical protein